MWKCTYTPENMLVVEAIWRFQGSKLDRADLRGIRGRYAIWRNANWWDARMNDDLRKALTKKWPREDE